MRSIFDGLGPALSRANVGCVGAVILTLVVASLIFGLVLMAWWPYMGGGE